MITSKKTQTEYKTHTEATKRESPADRETIATQRASEIHLTSIFIRERGREAEERLSEEE